MAYLFLMDGIARKKLPARAGVLNGHWHWPSLPTADAFRDDKSDVEAMRAGLTTRTAIIAKNGDGTFEDVLARGTQEAIAIEIATQDANRELVRRGYKPTVADLNIAQDTANPTQQPEPAPEANKPQGEAPANATAALAFDESKHPRADDGKFGSGGGEGGKSDETGEGADGKQKPVSQMSKGEKKTHDMRKKLEALRAKNAEGAKKLADTNARVSELHSQLVEQLKAGTGTANDDLKKTVSELGAKIAETKMHTKTIQHALRGEDIAADEHGQDSPQHEAAQKRTEYVAKKAAEHDPISEAKKPANPAEAFKAKHGRDPTFKELHSGKGGLIEKLDKFDKANLKPSHSIRDVTPEGFGPTDSGHDANKPDPERLPAPDATTVQNLKNSIAEAQTILKGKLTPEKQAQIYASLEATKKKLQDLQNHEPASPNEPAAKGGEKGSDSLSSLQNQSEGKSPSSAFQKPNPDGNQPLDKIDTEKADKVFIHSSLLQDLKTGSNLNNAIRFEHPGQKDKGLHYWKEKIANGERPPILIGGGSNLKIFDGNHRAAAYKELGIENIPAILTDKAAELLRGKKEA
jgi:hypothetical protein